MKFLIAEISENGVYHKHIRHTTQANYWRLETDFVMKQQNWPAKRTLVVSYEQNARRRRNFLKVSDPNVASRRSGD